MNETWWVSQDDLSQEQLKVLDLPLGKSHLIIGPPGCGKTNLLMLRANYIHLAGHPKIEVVVLTRTLQEFLKSGAAGYDFPVSKISTQMGWMSDLLYSYGKEVPKESSFKLTRAKTLAAVEDLIVEHNLSGLYEVLLLDEAQDYQPEEITVFAKLSKTIFAVADSNQKIYKGPSPLKALVEIAGGSHELLYHFRCGRKICRLADVIAKDSDNYKPIENTSNYDEVARPSTVHAVACADLDAQIAKVLEAIELQLKTYPDELLGICSLENDTVDTIWAAVQASPFAAVSVLQKSGRHAPFHEDARVCVSTIHAAKGLEVRGLHLVGMETLAKWGMRKTILFTAVTRAKTSLAIYYSGELRSLLEAAVASLEPLPELPKLSAAFGKGK